MKNNKFNPFQRFLGKLGVFKWMLHNLIAHPVSELIYYAGFCSSYAERIGNWIHDNTVPEHEQDLGRG